MTLTRFAAECKLTEIHEIARACYLAFYYLLRENVTEFSAADCANWFDGLHLAKPNISRLAENLKKCRDTVNASKPGLFRLHHSYITGIGSEVSLSRGEIARSHGPRHGLASRAVRRNSWLHREPCEADQSIL